MYRTLVACRIDRKPPTVRQGPQTAGREVHESSKHKPSQDAGQLNYGSSKTSESPVCSPARKLQLLSILQPELMAARVGMVQNDIRTLCGGPV
jgi:hypothetical protein